MIKNTLTKIELYVLSLSILFAIIVVLTIDVPISFNPEAKFIGFYQLIGRNLLPTISLTMLLLSLFFFWRFKQKLKGSRELPVKILEVDNINFEPLSFLATYIIPLSCFDLHNGRSLFTLLILLIIIGAIYVRTNTFYANPSLTLLGYSVYKVQIKQRDKLDECILITRDDVKVGRTLSFIKLDDKIIYGKLEGT